ncbi:MAG: hypothetical protein Kow0059_01800 [Candidatus Sumerlaeia bacterium]
MVQDALQRADRVCRLLDIYGGLLTQKQRLFCEQHFAEDLSFGEIAARQGITRQAVHDTVRNALSLLEHYETQLKLLANEQGLAGTEPLQETSQRPRETADAQQPADASSSERSDGLSAERLAAVREALADLRMDLKRRGGVIYDGQSVIRRLAEIEEWLEP